LIAVIGAKLVVVVILNARPGKVTIKRFEVFVREARSSMQQENLDGWVVANALRPHLKNSLRRVHRDHFHTAGQNVVTARVVQVID